LQLRLTDALSTSCINSEAGEELKRLALVDAELVHEGNLLSAPNNLVVLTVEVLDGHLASDDFHLVLYEVLLVGVEVNLHVDLIELRHDFFEAVSVDLDEVSLLERVRLQYIK